MHKGVTAGVLAAFVLGWLSLDILAYQAMEHAWVPTVGYGLGVTAGLLIVGAVLAGVIPDGEVAFGLLFLGALGALFAFATSMVVAIAVATLIGVGTWKGLEYAEAHRADESEKARVREAKWRAAGDVASVSQRLRADIAALREEVSSRTKVLPELRLQKILLNLSLTEAGTSDAERRDLANARAIAGREQARLEKEVDVLEQEINRRSRAVLRVDTLAQVTRSQRAFADPRDPCDLDREMSVIETIEAEEEIRELLD